jgi:fructan beta-fructosidase
MKHTFTLLTALMLTPLAPLPTVGLASPPEPAPERTRTVRITGDFLQLPLMQRATGDRKKDREVFEKLSIEADGKVLRYMNIDLPQDGKQPDFWYSADLREFKGREVTLRIKSHDATALERLEFSDKEIIDPHAYDGPYRPRFHFSPRLGWMNDINGSYYQNGLYHLFYQFNPASTGAGAGFDMHWGHSVSKDLVDWEEWPVALFPDASGQCWSGTTVMQQHPIPGVNEDVKLPAPAMFFTAAKEPHSQHLATTPDRGRTWKRFAAIR